MPPFTAPVWATTVNFPPKTFAEFVDYAKARPGQVSYGVAPGFSEFVWDGFRKEMGLVMNKVPYRDINVAPTDLGEGRIQIVMSSFAIVQPQWQAGRIKIIAVNNKTRAPIAPEIPTAREAGFASLEVEGLVGLFGLKTMSNELKEKIAADFKAAAADGSIGERLKSTGQVINVGGPKEFADAIEEQRANVEKTVKAIDFKPKQ